MKLTQLLLLVTLVTIAAAGAEASGTEIKGVIATQAVDPGDVMNPKFTGTVDINVHAPAAPNAATGLMVVLHGIGTNFHAYDTECESWVDTFNVYTVQVNYRGTGSPPPGYDLGKYQAIDVLRVVKYVVDNYTIDRTRIILWGASGGGNVALHTAKMAPNTFSMVAALSPITRPTNDVDRTTLGYLSDPAGGWEGFMLGLNNTYTTEEWDIRDAQYLARYLQGIPIYLVHGDADPVVDWQHSADMYAALAAAGVTSTLITVAGGDHNFNGAKEASEGSRFKVTQKFLATPINTLKGSGVLDQDRQRKITFPTRGTAAYPVKFDAQGLATLDRVPKPGGVVSLGMTNKQVKQGENLSFAFGIDNWAGAQQASYLLAGFYQISNGAVYTLVGPAPFLLPAQGVQISSVSLPVSAAFPVGDYLFVAILIGNTPSNYLDLDYFQFTVTAGS